MNALTAVSRSAEAGVYKKEEVNCQYYFRTLSVQNHPWWRFEVIYQR